MVPSVCQLPRLHRCLAFGLWWLELQGLLEFFIGKYSKTTGWERSGQMLCIVDTSLSVLMTLRVCLPELFCLFTV